MRFRIADLSGDTLALAVDDTVIIDINAAGHEWFVDDSPYQDSEFLPQGNDSELVAREPSAAYGDTDLLTVVMHELGHVFGFGDLDPVTNPDDLMAATLDTGVRHLPGNNGTGQSHESKPSLVAMDLTPDETDDDAMDALVNENPWLVNFLVARASDDTDPNSDIIVVINDDDAQDTGDDRAVPPPSNNGNGKRK